jgi:hypothetical protein
MDMETALEYVGESEGLQADGFEDCIIGVAERCSQQPLLVYDVNKIIEKLMKDGLSYDEAREHYEFNIVGAWVGEGTPLFMEPIEK